MTEHRAERRRAPRVAMLAAALGAALAGLGGCEDEDGLVELTHREAYEEREAVSVTEPGEFQDVPPVPEQGVGGETCMQARLCCEEFVSTMALHSDEVSDLDVGGCAEVVPEGTEDPREHCEDRIRVWAEALQAANIERPLHCT